MRTLIMAQDINTPYRIPMGGEEVLQLLRSVNEKIDKSSISQDKDDTDETTVVSSAIFNEVFTKLTEDTTGEGLKQAIEDIPDSNIFTDQHKAAVENIALRFLGVVSNESALPSGTDTDSFRGGEVALVLQNTWGNPDFYHWNKGTEKWNALNKLKQHEEILIESRNSTARKTYPRLDYTCFVYRVIAVSRTSTLHAFHTADITLGCIGDDTYMSVSNEVISDPNNPLVEFSSDVITATDQVELLTTTQVDDINLRVEVITAI